MRPYTEGRLLLLHAELHLIEELLRVIRLPIGNSSRASTIGELGESLRLLDLCVDAVRTDALRGSTEVIQ